MIPYGHQSIEDDDVERIVAVLKGDWLTQGPHVEQFEADLAAATGARYAVAFANGTAALHAAAAAAGLGPGDTVATSALTFAASANCARYVGATPVLVDIDEATYNLDLAQVPDGVDAVVAVHYAGLPVDLTRLKRRPRILIEDASHSIGATTPDGPVGNCARSDMTTFSFHPVKTITTGEGGAVTTNSPELADGLRRFRNHGIERKPEAGGWYYEVVDTGFNYRLTDLQAALGSQQLTKLERFVERRNAIARRYAELLAGLPVTLPPGAPAAPTGWRHAYHLYAVRVPERDRVYQAMRDGGVGVQVHYVPMYRHPVFAPQEVLPVTERVYQGLLSLPMFPALSDAEQDTVVEVLAGASGS